MLESLNDLNALTLDEDSGGSETGLLVDHQIALHSATKVRFNRPRVRSKARTTVRTDRRRMTERRMKTEPVAVERRMSGERRGPLRREADRRLMPV